MVAHAAWERGFARAASDYAAVVGEQGIRVGRQRLSLDRQTVEVVFAECSLQVGQVVQQVIINREFEGTGLVILHATTHARNTHTRGGGQSEWRVSE